MIEKLGIGIDIVDIKRFERIQYSPNSKFYKKIFNTSEIKHCLKLKNPYEHFAGKFAIKEAVKKSISEQIPILDIETFHYDSKPKVRVRAKIGKKYNFIVSLSHEKKFAIAVVISKRIC